MPVHVQTKFAWPESMDPYDQEIIQRETKATLTRLLKTCQIQSPDDEGSVLIFAALRNFVIFTTSHQVTLCRCTIFQGYISLI